MAEVFAYTPEEAREVAEWIESRPPAVQEVARRFHGNRLYRIKSTGQRVTVHSFQEHKATKGKRGKVTMTVIVSGKYNLVMFPTQVFGIDPNDLEECDLPSPEEPVGEVLKTQAQIDSYVEMIRPAVLAARKEQEG